MRVNLDESFLTDPRFRKLSLLSGISEDEARMAMVRVWFHCYQARSAEVDVQLVGIASQHPKHTGFVNDMIESGLAERTRKQGTVRIRGVAGRISYLLSAEDRGRSGGLKSGESRRHRSTSFKQAEATASSTAQASLNPPAPAPAPDLNTKTPLTPQRGARVETELLEYLNQKAGTKYRPVDSHLRHFKARLKDHPPEAIRKVIDSKVAEWKGTGMERNLVPETLLRPKNFDKYLDRADSPSTADHAIVRPITGQNIPRDIPQEERVSAQEITAALATALKRPY